MHRSVLASVLVVGLSSATQGQQFGPMSTVAAGAVSAPDVAYDPSRDLYLVAWEEALAGGGTEVFARRVDADGSPLGPASALSATTTARAPQVAIVAARESFVVMWRNPTGFSARTVRTATGSLGAIATVALSPGTPLGDVGGSISPGGRALAVWSYNPTGAFSESRVLGAMLDVSAEGAIDVGPARMISANSLGQGDFNPRISATGGPTDRWLVTWEARWGLHPGHEAAIVGPGAFVVDRGLLPFRGDSHAPAGDGCDPVWMVASIEASNWTVAETLGAATNGGFWFGSQAWLPGPAVFTGSPEVAWLGESYLVGFARNGRIGEVTSLDLGCQPCEGVTPIDLDVAAVVLASQRSAGVDGASGALVVWTWAPAAGTAEIRARSYTANDGIVTELGGGCGRGGESRASCAVVGHGAFHHRLLAAADRATAALVLGANTVSLGCGPCSLRVDPLIVLPAPTTDAAGNTGLAMPIPADPTLVGLSLTSQWIVVHGGAPACGVGIDFSDALRIELQ